MMRRMETESSSSNSSNSNRSLLQRHDGKWSISKVLDIACILLLITCHSTTTSVAHALVTPRSRSMSSSTGRSSSFQSSTFIVRPKSSDHYHYHHDTNTALWSTPPNQNNNNDDVDKDDMTMTSKQTDSELLPAEQEQSSQSSSQQLDWNKIVVQSQLFYELSVPFYKESIRGRWLFGGMIGMTLINSAVSVAFSYLGKDFWNALSDKNPDEFYIMLLKFGAALVVGAPVIVLYRFQRERLSVCWREWMTNRTLDLYSQHRVYYSLSYNNEYDIDNPDQRIAEDVRTFTTFSLELFLTMVTSIIDLCSFSTILYSIQPSLFVAIAVYATLGTIGTTVLGKSLVSLNFRKLQTEANFRFSLVRWRENAESIAFYGGEALERQSIAQQFDSVLTNKRNLMGAQRNLEFFTTAYRYLIQVLPVAVVAPRYFAGAVPLGVVSQSAGAFNHILNDLSIIVNEFEQLSSFSAGMDRLGQFYSVMREVNPERSSVNNTSIVTLLELKPAAVAAEEMDSLRHKDSHTVLTNGQQNGASTNGVDSHTSSPSTIQLIQFNLPSTTDAHTASSQLMVALENVLLMTPDRKRTLIKHVSLELFQGQHLLIVGDSGAGKSSLLRAIAGLWTAGSGSIQRPTQEDVYFLPQRPYCSVGTLKDQLLYPSLECSLDNKGVATTFTNLDDKENTEQDNDEMKQQQQQHHLRQAWSDQDLLEVLKQVRLEELASRMGDGDAIAGLYSQQDWSNMLSLGEQQRLAFGRLLVNQPKLVILDEATSALDIQSEAKMYELLQEMSSPSTTSSTTKPDGVMNSFVSPGLTYISVGHRPSLLAYHDKKLRLSGPSGYELTDIVMEENSIDMMSSQRSNL